MGDPNKIRDDLISVKNEIINNLISVKLDNEKTINNCKDNLAYYELLSLQLKKENEILKKENNSLRKENDKLRRRIKKIISDENYYFKGDFDINKDYDAIITYLKNELSKYKK